MVYNLTKCSGHQSRGTDFERFQFVGSLYPKHGKTLPEALGEARKKYPMTGTGHADTTLCLSHFRRVQVNHDVDELLRRGRDDAVFLPEPKTIPAAEKNRPQNMSIWPGAILIARVDSKDSGLKNGLRYRVVQVRDAMVDLVQLNKDDEVPEGGTSFELLKVEVAAKLRLTHAITYFSSQARTILGSLRLVDTASQHFTLRHLIVGLGRAPNGSDVQVE